MEAYIHQPADKVIALLFLTYTVDGSEIQHSPVEVGSLSHYLQGFKYIPGGCLEFLPSTVAPETRPLEKEIYWRPSSLWPTVC